MKKKEARIYYKNLRNLLNDQQLNELSLKIINNFISNFELENKIISVFLPIQIKKEINTNYLLNEDLKIKIALPKWNLQTNELIHLLYHPKKTKLITSEFGIQEPSDGILIEPNNIDIVLTPLLAVDKKGFRVGYGKGVYDIFFKSCNQKTLKIGLHLFDIIEKIDDINTFDIPLDYCITPESIIRFE
jgi:5-formyltetrahydrofolate cyclo-ligase